MVKCKVTILSHPTALVNVCVGLDEEEYVVPYQVKLVQADTVVSPVELAFGAAIPLPVPLVHPPMVCVTVYVPPVVTVIDEVVALVLHKTELPEIKPVAANVEDPQLFVTLTPGVAGVAK